MNDPTGAPLMLSISGARGIVGESMTPAVAERFAAAFGSYLRETTGRADPVICLGRDSRRSGEQLAPAAADGLGSVGGRVVDLGVVTTPSVAVMVDSLGAAGGLIVTASHNPLPWNGLKCLLAGGVAPPPEHMDRIIDRFTAPDVAPGGASGTPPPQRDDSAHERHVARVLDHVDPGPVRVAGFTVLLDSVNGAGCAPGRMLLERLGCTVIHENGEPTGDFAHPPEPTEANLAQVAPLVAARGAAAGFAQDPDADRLAIIDERGTYIGEECTLVLAAKRLLDREGGGPLVVNLSTSRMIDDLAARYPGASVIRTPVGEANVAAAMQAAGALVGGEGNGGVIFPPVCRVRDSLTAMALVLELMAAEGRPLSAIVADLPRYYMIKHSFRLQAGGEAASAVAIQRVVSRFADRRLNTEDGVRADFDDGWIHLRPSNTEPIVRLIVEAKTPQRARALLDEVAAAAGLV